MGAGLIGLVHAHEARRRGLNVVLLERDLRARGASVRHAGHLFFSALASGDPLDAALLARKRWIDLTWQAGLLADDAGTLIVARNQDELAVMDGAAADPARRAQILTAAEIEALVPIPVDGVVGGFHATRDLRIEPRAATAGLARLLERDPGARVEWGAPVHEIEPGVVHSGGLRVRAQAIVVCPGAGQLALPPALASRQDRALVWCRTQMLRLAPPTGRRYRPALATGVTLLQHPAFAEQDGAEAVRARLELEKPEVVDGGAQLLVTQHPSGELVIGQTRAEEQTLPTPFALERFYRLLLGEAKELLGVVPDVRQRWQATELAVRSPDTRDFVVSAPMPGVRVVQGVSGRDLALAPVKAGRTLDALLVQSTIPEFETAVAPSFVLRDRRMRGGLRAHADAFRVHRAGED